MTASVAKLSISLPIEAIATLRRRAEEQDTTVSALIADAVDDKLRAEAARLLIQELGGMDDVTDADREAVFAQWKLAAEPPVQKPPVKVATRIKPKRGSEKGARRARK